MDDLVICWKEKRCRGWLDILPIASFALERSTDRFEHEVVDSQGRKSKAVCRLSVVGRSADLDYSPYSDLNMDRGMDLGILRLIFTGPDRAQVQKVEWKDKEGTRFRPALIDLVHDGLYGELTRMARSGETDSYQNVSRRSGLPDQWPKLKSIAGLLDAISRYEHARGRPLLSVLVGGKGSKNFPEDGFFPLARELGKQKGQDDREFYLDEREKVFAHWGGQSGGVDQPGVSFWLEDHWPAFSDRPFGVWFHAKKRYGSDKMKAGDRVIFYETGGGPEKGLKGAKSIFASGTLTGRMADVPEEYDKRGEKEWLYIKLVETDIRFDPEDGVSIDAVRDRFGKRFNGLIRQVSPLTADEFETLHGLLKEHQQRANKKRAEALDRPLPEPNAPEFQPFVRTDARKFKSGGKNGDPAARLEALERASNSHEDIRAALGDLIKRSGADPKSHRNVDLRAVFGAEEWFFEVKSNDDDNVMGQIRSGVGQLLEYRHRFGTPQTRLALVIQSLPKEPLWDFIGHLDTMGIVLCWQDDGGFEVHQRQRTKAGFLP